MLIIYPRQFTRGESYTRGDFLSAVPKRRSHSGGSENGPIAQQKRYSRVRGACYACRPVNMRAFSRNYRVRVYELRNTMKTNTAHEAARAINGYRNGRREKNSISSADRAPRPRKPLYERDFISRENTANTRA